MRNRDVPPDERASRVVVQGDAVSVAPGPSRAASEWALEIALFAGLHFAAGVLSLAISLANGYITLVWPATGVAVAGLWLRGRSLWPAVLIGGFLTTYYNAYSPLFAVFGGLGNALEAFIAVTLLQRWGFCGRLDRAVDVFRLIGATFVGAAVCATLGVIGVGLAGLGPWSASGVTWATWATADALGVLCLAPLFLTWATSDAARVCPRVRTELIVLAVVYALTELAFYEELGLGGSWSFVQAYLPFPFLLWAALRLGPPGASATVFLLTALTVWRCVTGVGEPWHLERAEALAPIALFVLVSASTTLVLAAYHQETIHAADALARTEAEARKLALVAGRTQQGMAICDAERRVEWCNPALQTLTGLTPDSTLGRPLEVLLALQFSNGQMVADAVRKLHQGLSTHLEGWCHREDGTRYWAELDVEPLDGASADGSGRWTLVQRDASERQEAHLALQAAKEAAEAAHRMKTEFLANMSHEIRTPMTAIVGYADLLAKEDAGAPISVERRQALEAMHRNGKQLLTMVDDMLELSNAELGRTAIEIVPFQPARLVEEVVQTFRPRATAQGLTIGVRCEPSTPTVVGGDPRCVRQVLRHLLANAVKFTEKGSIRVTVASPSERVLTIAVADSGVGISPERAAQLFRPFMQADGSTSRRFGGVGLGLAVSKRLSNLLGGDVTVAGRPGEGSVFTFSMRFEPTVASLNDPASVDAEADTVEDVTKVDAPSERTAIRPPTRPSDETVEARKPELLGVRVLLAEDGVDNQRLLSAILRKAGAEVALAENGAEAVHAATESERAKTPFDVVLMDMQMPIVDGYEATRTLKKNGYPRPIMALTAHAMKGDDERCYASGCDAYATKPITKAELIAAVRQILAKHSFAERVDRPLAGAE